MVDFPASHVSFRWMYIVVATKIRGTKRINPIGDPIVQEKWPWSKERSQCDREDEFSSLARLLRFPVPSSSADDESQPITHPSSCSIEQRKKPLLLSIESWSFNRDPYFMVYYNPYIPG